MSYYRVTGLDAGYKRPTGKMQTNRHISSEAHAQVFVHCRYMGYCQKVICVDSYRVFHVYRFKYSLVGFKALH